MHIFFTALASLTTLFFGASLFFATAFPDRLYHFYFGLIGAVTCLLTHCWVFFYFIGTGEGIREGILENKLDLKHIKTTKKFKGRTFPFALFSMIFVIVGSVMGGALRGVQATREQHLGWIFFAVAFNLYTFRKEFRVIQENRKLMDLLNSQVDSNAA